MYARARTSVALATMLGMTAAVGCAAASAAPPLISAASVQSVSTGTEDARTKQGGTARTETVTLLTGDRVAVATHSDGRRTATVLQGPGRENMVVQQQRVGEALYVIPADVAPLVPEVLDRDLFDVAKLVDAGYGDADRADMPVILEGFGGASGGRPDTRAPDWAALDIDPEHELQSIGAVSAHLPKRGVGNLLDALRATNPGKSPAERAMARAFAEDVPAAAENAAAGVTHVYLDEPVQPTDADSMPQIGAPQAWDAGYTGEGVTVAVLDTGLDPTHPDLDQSVVGSRDFTGGGDPTDTVGHGTHVASIAIGSGEASGGVNRGVAPGAKLLAGKVLGGEGDYESTVIDGMEWAVSEGADIVNMSLGFGPTDGTDPMAVAVNELTAQHDTLFVVSAGNLHYHGTVGTPGSADAALTVGGVDDDEGMYAGSSKGPRGGDHAVKPDITAPGVGIVAARAAGTSLGSVVDQWYTSTSGTSMAAPHVAGAAAVLKSAHPEWGAAELKARLMGSAQPGPDGRTVWEEGAGRMWIPGALTLPATAAPASLSFGALEEGLDGPSTRSLTYTNFSDQAIELALSSDLRGPDGELVDGGIALATERLSVAAGGTASVDVTLDNSVGAVGRYSGAITATVAGGTSDGATVRTPLGYQKLPERFDLTIQTLGRDGEPFTGWSSLALMDLEDSGRYGENLDFHDGQVTVRVPAGTYGVTGALSEGDYDAWQFDVVTGIADADVTVERDTTITLSAEDALPASVTTPKPAEVAAAGFHYQLLDAHGYSTARSSFSVPGETDLYFARSEEAATGDLRLVNSYLLRQPVGEGADPAYTYDLAFQQPAVADVTFEVQTDDLAAINTAYATAPAGSTATTYRYAHLSGVYDRPAHSSPTKPGTTRTAYVLAGDVEWNEVVTYGGETPDGEYVDYGSWESVPTAYTPGQRSATVFGGAVHSSAALSADRGDDFLLYISGWGDGDAHTNVLYGANEQMRLWRDGDLITEGTQLTVPMPEEPTPFRLEYSGTRDDGWLTAPRVSGEWEFTAGPAGELDSRLALLDVDYDVAGLRLDGTAPRRTTITVNAVAPGRSSATSARVSWSADDGATWQRVATRSMGHGKFAVEVVVPAGTERVSLDVKASNAQGSVHETTIGAYVPIAR